MPGPIMTELTCMGYIGDVNGHKALPLFTYLKEQTNKKIEWYVLSVYLV